MKRLLTMLLGFSLMSGLVVWGQGSYLVRNIGSSMPARRYLCTPLRESRALEMDQVVLFPWPEAIQETLARIAPFVDVALPCLKQVAGLAGDVVCWDADGMTINARPGYALPLLARYPIEAPSGCHVVSGTDVFLLGTDPHSFDSRYIGPLPLTSLQATCRKLW
jgi:type IV secretory pathway protease TraF